MTLEDHPPLKDLAPPAWSKSQLRRLGDSIRDGETAPGNCPSYVEVITWYDDLAVTVQDAIRGLDWASLLVGRPAPVFSSRAKTIDTLRDKLRRDRATPLGNVQDVAGVRFECEMTLEEQTSSREQSPMRSLSRTERSTTFGAVPMPVTERSTSGSTCATRGSRFKCGHTSKVRGRTSTRP